MARSRFKAGNYCWYRIYRPIPPNTAQYRPIPPNTAQYRPIPPNTAKYRQIPPNTAKYRQIPPNTAKYRQIPPHTATYRQILRIWRYIITSSVIILSNINITCIENIKLEILNFFKRRCHVSRAVFISSNIVHSRLISSMVRRLISIMVV